ncbi:hypothetical protein Y032_0338g2931 [Ancylostoma ceylanicum]|uniref:Uncharacterized protein n=1 Tax=Ancylostoma ceylanicum TaxID=53326 RepID=A0A016RYA8_9BILA|nr:hypothetical protein Y032_0338g2931 [Ancylostoma ceylanicum]
MCSPSILPPTPQLRAEDFGWYNNNTSCQEVNKFLNFEAWCLYFTTHTSAQSRGFPRMLPLSYTYLEVFLQNENGTIVEC